MFEKITDFDNKFFKNLWGGFSCECFVDNNHKFISFHRNGGREQILLNGSAVEDVLDFVLSQYYEYEDTVIEDGFSKWLEENYQKNCETVNEEKQIDEHNLADVYNMAVKDLNKQEKIIKNQKREIRNLKQKLEKASYTNFNLRKELEMLKNR